MWGQIVEWETDGSSRLAGVSRSLRSKEAQYGAEQRETDAIASKYTVSNDNAALFAVGPSIDAGGQLTYTLNANVNGTATVTVSVTDSGGTANGGDDTSPDQTFDIVIAPVNDPPITIDDAYSVDEDGTLG